MWKSSVPIFRLVDTTGHVSGTETLWQKQEMLVAVVDTEDCAACDALERALRAEEDEWSREHAGLVFVPLNASGEGARIVELLFEAFAPLGVTPGTPTLGLADRFGRLYAALDVHDTDVDQLLREARDWIDFVQQQCDECGVPVEPPPETPLADSADDGPG